MKFNFRDIAAALDVPRIATCSRDGQVTLFDVQRGVEVSQFATALKNPGLRMAVSPNGRYVAFASSELATVTVYDDQGTCLWRRGKLDDLQVISFSLDSELLYCSHHRGLVSAFHADDGQSARFTWLKKRMKGSYRLFESAYDDRFLNDRMEASLKLCTKSLQSVASIDRRSSALLDAVFAPEFLCLAESGVPLRCYHIDGSLVWELDHEKGSHALDLAYDAERKFFLAVTWPSDDQGVHYLLGIQPATGEVVSLQPLPDECSFQFADGGRLLVSSTGEIYRTQRFEQIAALASAS